MVKGNTLCVCCRIHFACLLELPHLSLPRSLGLLSCCCCVRALLLFCVLVICCGRAAVFRCCYRFRPNAFPVCQVHVVDVCRAIVHSYTPGLNGKTFNLADKGATGGCPPPPLQTVASLLLACGV